MTETGVGDEELLRKQMESAMREAVAETVSIVIDNSANQLYDNYVVRNDHDHVREIEIC